MRENTVVSSFCALDTNFQLLGMFVCECLISEYGKANMLIPNQKKKKLKSNCSLFSNDNETRINLKMTLEKS